AFGRGGRLCIFGGMPAGALDGPVEADHTKGDSGSDAGRLHTRQRGELVVDITVKLAGPHLVVATETGVGLDNDGVLRLESDFGPPSLERAPDEQAGAREQPEREGNLGYDEGIAWEPPAPRREVLASLLLEVGDHVTTGELEGWPEGEEEGG